MGLLSKKDAALITDPLADNNPITIQVLGICSALAITAELKASKASRGTLAFSIDEGSHGAIFVYTGNAWKKVEFAAG